MWRYSGTEAATNHAKCIVAHDVTERTLMDQRPRNTVNRLLAHYDAGRILGSSLQQETIRATLVEIVRRVADSSAARVRSRWCITASSKTMPSFGTSSSG